MGTLACVRMDTNARGRGVATHRQRALRCVVRGVGRALHEDGRRFYDVEIARELLAEIGAPDDMWDAALADPTTHDDVRRDHDHAVQTYGEFGVPIIVFAPDAPSSAPSSCPRRPVDDALAAVGPDRRLLACARPVRDEDAQDR